MNKAKPRNVSRSPFMKTEILSLSCKYILLLMNFVTNIAEFFSQISTVHSVKYGNENQLHKPATNVSCFQKCAHCTGIGMFVILPPRLKTISNKKETEKVALKRYLNILFILLSNSAV
jgi:hypothetical protein